MRVTETKHYPTPSQRGRLWRSHERYAKAAYYGAINATTAEARRAAPWRKLPLHSQRHYRRIARAVLAKLGTRLVGQRAFSF